MSEETKEKISNTLKGRKRSKESIEKQKESYKKENHYMYGKKRSKELSMSIGEKIKKPVKLINKDGNIIMKTDSITKMLDYLRKNNIPTTIIHRYLNKPFKSNRNKEYNMWTCTYVQK
jgi:hypothetical protein